MADRTVATTDTLDTLRTTYNSTAGDVGDISGVTGASGIIAHATDIVEAITLMNTEVNAIKAAYAGKPNIDIVVYEGAGHSFSMPRNQGFDANVAKTSRDSVLAFFRSM